MPPTANAVRPFEFPDKVDFYTKHGANVLCDAISTYWLKRGYAITTERYLVEGTVATWSVRSNLVNGLPRTWRGK